MKTVNLLTSMLLLLLLLGCNQDDDVTAIQTEFTGPKVTVGDGQAWSYVRTDEAGTPRAIGVQFDEGALENLPSGHMHAHEFVLALPAEVSVAPYDHITLDWNEHGHEPPGVYDLPHFDLHFYFMSEDERNEIGIHDTLEFNKPLPAEHLAPMYLETPGGVPRMGAHVIDLLSPEIAGTGTFTHTFIYGKYDGELNFLEPMVTRDFLQSKTPVTKEIRHPQSWQQSGFYPDNYTIEFDPAAGVYSILLRELEEF